MKKRWLISSLLLVLLFFSSTYTNAQIGTLNITERDSSLNPLDTFVLLDMVNAPRLVDIDADGDLDCFLWIRDVSNQRTQYRYLENVGTANNAFFVERFMTDNPLFNIEMFNLTFVDIDNDGDYDYFASNGLYASSREVMFYENTGTAASAQFVKRTGSLNPLDGLIALFDATFGPSVFSLNIGPGFSFVDIDADGDMDLFTVNCAQDSIPEYFWYYENTGTAVAPVFQKQLQSANPMGNIIVNTATTLARVYYQSPVFIDLDADNDLDCLYQISDTLHTLENIGTASNPNFLRLYTNIMDSVNTAPERVSEFSFADIDNDNDLDVFYLYKSLSFIDLRYFENLTDTITGNHSIQDFIGSFSKIVTYPNPANDIVHFDQQLSGSIRLYNISGQEVYAAELRGQQQMNVASLQNGLYLMLIDDSKHIKKATILIER